MRLRALVQLAKACPVSDRGRVYAEMWNLMRFGLVTEQRKYGEDWLCGHCFCLMPRFVEEYNPTLKTPLSYMKQLIAWTAPRHMAKERSALSVPLDPGESARNRLKGYEYMRSGAMDNEAFAALLEEARLEGEEED